MPDAAGFRAEASKPHRHWNSLVDTTEFANGRTWLEAKKNVGCENQLFRSYFDEIKVDKSRQKSLRK